MAPFQADGEYDGLNRRVKKHFDSDAPADPNGIDSYRHFYYSRSWQVLETRLSTRENTDPNTLDPEYQYVWSMRPGGTPPLQGRGLPAFGAAGRLGELSGVFVSRPGAVGTAVRANLRRGI